MDFLRQAESGKQLCIEMRLVQQRQALTTYSNSSSVTPTTSARYSMGLMIGRKLVVFRAYSWEAVNSGRIYQVSAGPHSHNIVR